MIIIWSLVLFFLIQRSDGDGNYQYDKVCRGTARGLNWNEYTNNYFFFQTYFRDCQIIDGNLELASVYEIPAGSNFNFLSSIKEITGYLWVFDLKAESLNFLNLRIIRGRNTIKYDNCTTCRGYSLSVEKSDMLKEILMPNLTEISHGDVKFSQNSNLCFIETIDWKNEILNSNESTVTMTKNGIQCERCPSSCRIAKSDKRSCWSKAYCQQSSKTCPQKCRGRCNKSYCCDDQCSAGCYGPYDYTCNACKEVNYDGRCVSDCPSLWISNGQNGKMEKNPNGRVNSANQCKLQCPAHMVQYDSRCLLKCPGKTFNENFEGICVPCKGECPKTCNGTGEEGLNSGNINEFVGCESVAGNIVILESSFKQNVDVPPLAYSDLSVLSHVTEIEEYLFVNAKGSNLPDLGFLKNLRVIQGRDLYKSDALVVTENPELEELGLNGLKKISRGDVVIYSNEKLCYVDLFNWTALFRSDDQTFKLDLNNTRSHCETKICDAACDSNGCLGPGGHQCYSCSRFSYGQTCLTRCSGLRMPIYNATGDMCEDCHPQCKRGCDGPSDKDCWECENYEFNLTCVSQCPHNMLPNENRKCQRSSRNLIIGGIVSGVLLLVLTLILAIICCRRQIVKDKRKTAEFEIKLNRVELEPLVLGQASPDMSKMMVVGEESLKKGPVIGSGAFGTVYRGYWIPEKERIKIPVAIKVLNENNQKAQAELLEEARIMASVTDDFCVRILAICVSKNLQLVTKLMPHGCLLSYVRNNKGKIGSKILLEWCNQIAKGMSYLEKVHIIHRDLAARNVLVQTPTHVRITDFGLSKLVPETDTYLENGGKLPIKWLALESIRDRVFSHKSDVWSYGITIWELFTFGERPYGEMRVHDVIRMLDKGERLPQPDICTIDVYMLMINCWLVDSDARPSFANLVKEFSRMARDPGCYLVIPNDALMRSPSQSVADGRDLLRGISLGSNPDDAIVDADVYLKRRVNPPLNSLVEEDAADAHQPINEHPKNTKRNRNPRGSLTVRTTSMSTEDSQNRYTPSPNDTQNLAIYDDKKITSDNPEYSTPKNPYLQNRTTSINKNKKLEFKGPEYDVPKSIRPNLDWEAYLEVIDDDESKNTEEDENSDADAGTKSQVKKYAENLEYFTDIL